MLISVPLKIIVTKNIKLRIATDIKFIKENLG